MQIAQGKLLGHGRFEVIAPIGEGGAGVVYEVKDHESEARLALKTVRLISGPSALASLKREFRAARDLAHPNLVRLDELFEEEGAWFFTMELVEGTKWLNYVRPPGTSGFDEARLRKALVQTVEALAVLHGQGMVHRDVKPSNLLVSRDGTVKLLDFGITTSPEQFGEQSSVVGTIAYMAPEQLMLAESTAASDFYSLGVMLYQALCGRLPFFDRQAAMEEKLTTQPSSVKLVAPDVPTDLADLCDALLRPRPSERPTATEILRMLGAGDISGVPPEEVFVGRTQELAQLHAAAAAMKQGAALTVFVDGASGIGKSELIRHFLRQLPEEFLTFSGRCHEREFVPYNGLDGIVDKLAEYLAERSDEALVGFDEGLARLLTRLFPVLRTVPFFEQAVRFSGLQEQGEPREVRLGSYRAFRELIARLAGEHKLVLWVDDIHWADRDTLTLLAETLALPDPPPVLLLCTRRTDRDLDRASLSLPGKTRRLELGSLSVEEVFELATRLADGSVGEQELAQIVRESAGHPLFLRELLLRYRDPAHRATYVDLDAALWARVVQLAPAERRIVEAVAIAGIPTPLDLIGTAADVPRAELTEHLALLRGTHLVKISAAGSSRLIEPYHDRIREAALSELPEDVKRDWHRRLAEALDERGAREIEVQAMHWQAAGDRNRAALLCGEAAERANAQMAFERAVEFYERALSLLDSGAPQRGELELALAEALANAGRGGEAGKAFVKLALAEKADSPAAIELQSRAARAFLTSGRFEQGLLALRTAMASVGLPFPETRSAILCSLVWHRLRLQQRGLELRRRTEAERDPATRIKINVCWAAGHFPSMSHPIAGAVFHAYGTRLALDYGDPSLAIRALCGHANAMSTGGFKARKKTAELVERIDILHREVPGPYNDAFADGAAAFAAFMIEDWETARNYCARAEVNFRDRCVGTTYELATARLLYGRALGWLGRLVELEAYAVPILRDALRRNDLYSMINTRATACVLVALARDDIDAAQFEVDETLAALSPGLQLQHAYYLSAAGMVDLYRGAPEAVLTRREAHRKALRQSLLLKMPSISVLLDSLSARAHLQLAEREPANRAQHLRAVRRFATELQEEGPRPSHALGSVLHAGALVLDGKRDPAILELHAAIEIFEQAHMILHAAAARYALSTLVGDAEADELKNAADRHFNEQRVLAPQRFARFYAPGFGLER